MKNLLSTITLTLVFAIALAVSNAAAHEPIFGLGPRPIWKGGFGFETELERERESARWPGWRAFAASCKKR